MLDEPLPRERVLRDRPIQEPNATLLQLMVLTITLARANQVLGRTRQGCQTAQGIARACRILLSKVQLATQASGSFFEVATHGTSETRRPHLTRVERGTGAT